MALRNFFRLFKYTQVLAALEKAEETLIGGQAVIEGVMMRCPQSYCVAVRSPGGDILTYEGPLPKVSEKYPLFRLPVLRGLGTLGQALWLGIKALRFSANASLPAAEAGAKRLEISPWMMGLNMVFSFAFFIFLYKFVPLWVVTRLQEWLPALKGQIAFNLADGIIRMALFVAFLLLISRWRDIRRVFEYHGAEHRVVFNYESGRPVTVETAQTFSTFHPRCGTSFLLVVMMVSILVYTLVPFQSFGLRFLSRVLLLPLIAGLSYEAIRFAARNRGSLLATVTAPGLWLQRITTQPPSDAQTAVAIRALEGAMALEEKQGGQPVIA